jgi:signal transduction histidine kinase
MGSGRYPVESDQGDESVSGEIGANQILDGAGNVDSTVVVIHDNTRGEQAETELPEYREHLEALVEKRTAELKTANRSLQLRVEWLEAVNLVSQFVRGAPSPGSGYSGAEYSAQIYEKIVALIKRVFAVQDSFIAELEVHGKQPEQSTGLKILAHSCRSDSHLGLNEARIALPVAIQLELEVGNLVVIPIDKLREWDGAFGAHIQDSEVQSIALVSVKLGEQILGALGLEMREVARTITSEESNLLNIFSTDIARWIEGGRLFEQAKSLSVQEERNRLARDLHDSVTQVLFSANLVAEVLPQIWRRDPERGMQSLEKLQRLTRGALAEMRTMLLELRPSAVIQIPLSELLAQLTEAVTSRSGLPFQLFIEQIPHLPDEVHMNFYRIAQEALNNVVKHSQAQHVTVSLSAMPLPPDVNDLPGYEVKLVIQDDGVGFYAENDQSSHLGLNIMRERAAAIQATLTLESEPGYGTLVSLFWSSGSRLEDRNA